LGDSQYWMSSTVNCSLTTGPLGVAVNVGAPLGAPTVAVAVGDSPGVGTSVLVASGVTVGKAVLSAVGAVAEGVTTWTGAVAGIGCSDVWHANAANVSVHTTQATV
jgi:hypothetical protein